MSRSSPILLALAVAVFAGAAAAATPIEDRLAPILTSIAGRPASVHCWGTAALWDARKASVGVDPAAVAFVLPGTATIDASPTLCGELQAFAAQPPGARCRTGTKKVARSRLAWRWRIVVVRGARRRVRVRVKVTRVALVPVFGACRFTDAQLNAVWRIAHEAVHAGGIADEATAECLGLQALEETATALGAAPAAARAAAVRAAGRSGGDCRENGPLDASPGDGRWP